MLAMPRLPRISSKKAIKALERLGFEFELICLNECDYAIGQNKHEMNNYD